MCLVLIFTTGFVRVGKGRQQHVSKLFNDADARYAQGMCSTELWFSIEIFAKAC